MAHHKSAIKRIRTNEKSRLRNRHNMSNMRTALKKFQALLDENPEAAKKEFPKMMKVIGKTATKGAIKKNTASRKISRLAKAIERGLNKG